MAMQPLDNLREEKKQLGSAVDRLRHWTRMTQHHLVLALFFVSSSTNYSSVQVSPSNRLSIVHHFVSSPSAAALSLPLVSLSAESLSVPPILPIPEGPLEFVFGCFLKSTFHPASINTFSSTLSRSSFSCLLVSLLEGSIGQDI